jgi:hypothetical protein
MTTSESVAILAQGLPECVLRKEQACACQRPPYFFIVVPPTIAYQFSSGRGQESRTLKTNIEKSSCCDEDTSPHSNEHKLPQSTQLTSDVGCGFSWVGKTAQARVRRSIVGASVLRLISRADCPIYSFLQWGPHPHEQCLPLVHAGVRVWLCRGAGLGT